MAALKDIERGFYLDMAANDPVRDSISLDLTLIDCDHTTDSE